MNYTREQIEQKVMTNQAWLERAIVSIYERQTRDEQASENSKYNNLRGFNGPDAKRLTYYAKWIQKGRHLNGKHVEIAKSRIKKYCGQLTKIAKGEM